MQLDAAGFNSTEIYINLGLILGIPLILTALLPFAWVVDTFCTIKDARRERFGGRKACFSKSLLSMLVNLLSRYAIISIMDISMCIAMSLSCAYYEGYTPTRYKINISIAYVLLGILSFFIFFVIGHGIWRHFKAKRAKKWIDYEVSSCVSTLYEGANVIHPFRTTAFNVFCMLRKITFALTIVFLYESPVYQIFVLLITSIAYNVMLAYF